VRKHLAPSLRFVNPRTKLRSAVARYRIRASSQRRAGVSERRYRHGALRV
jgi:hypothetical protein